MGVFFHEKVLFLLFAPFFLPFGLLFLSFRVLSASSCFAFSFCFVSFSAVSLSFLLFVYLLAFALALLRASFLLLFLLLISPFSHFHSFSFLFISFVYDCPLFCLRCGRELRSIGKLRCRAGIDAVCKKRSREGYTIPLSTPNFSSAWHSPAGSTCTRISYILSIEFSILFSTASAMSCAWVTVICGFTSMSSVMM